MNRRYIVCLSHSDDSVSPREVIMSRNTIYIVSDEPEFIEKAKAYFGPWNVSFQNFSPQQWREGLSNASFITQIGGVPSLSTGLSAVDGGKVISFPGQPNPAGATDKVATMEELESKAIENAIFQYKGNLTEAAKALGIGRATLYRKVKQFQIDPSQARKRKPTAA
jgi:hypothetical protein